MNPMREYYWHYWSIMNNDHSKQIWNPMLSSEEYVKRVIVEEFSYDIHAIHTDISSIGSLSCTTWQIRWWWSRLCMVYWWIIRCWRTSWYSCNGRLPSIIGIFSFKLFRTTNILAFIDLSYFKQTFSKWWWWVIFFIFYNAWHIG